MAELPSSRWDRIKDLFSEAVALDPAARPGWIEQACGDDLALRRDVQALVSDHERAGGFLDTSALAVPGAALAVLAATAAPAATPDRCGAYRIVRELGRGGMGVVYLATRDDDRFEKLVAIKIVSGEHAHPSLVERFEDERRILASLDHPGIARLLDAGTTDAGVPFVVMEYVEGEPIDAYCSEREMPVRDRLALFVRVCAAMQYSHERLVVHRDIKARNILVSADGEPKLLDFGIAKLLEPDHTDGDVTRTAFRVLTPESASPEQLRGEPVTVSPDVYSLGVLLYRLLTDRGPYRGELKTEADIVHAVCDEQPVRPSSAVTAGDPRRRELRGDLDLITLKALEKDRVRRYGTVEQLAQDVQRHLDRLPILAAPDAWTYRGRKFVSRHWIGLTAVAAVVLALVAGGASTWWQAQRAERRFNDVRKLANTLMFDVHDAIATLPGSTSVRKLLVEKAVVYLDSLSREAGNDASLYRELATGYEKMADVLGRPNTPNLGDLSGALASYRKAQAARERLLTVDPGNLDVQRDMSTTSLKMSPVLLYSGDVPASVAEARKSVVIEERLAASDVTPAQSLRVGQSERLLGWMLGAEGQTVESIDRLKRARTVFEGLAATGWNRDEVQDQLASSYSHLADILISGAPSPGLVPDRAAASEMRRRALAIRQELSAAKPLDMTRQRAVFSERIEMGELSNMSGDWPASEAHFRLALADAERMSGADTANQQARADVAGASARLGRLLAQTGKPHEAVGLLNRAETLLGPLLAVDPTNISTQAKVAEYNVGFGFAYSAMAASPGTTAATRLAHWRLAKSRFHDGYLFWKDLRDRGVTTGEEAAIADDLAREIAKCDIGIARGTR